MEEQQSMIGTLDFIPQPAFFVNNGMITQVNHAARQRLINANTPIAALLPDHLQEYQAFTGGCLCLTLVLAGVRCNASVNKVNGMDLFIMEHEMAQPTFNALALAAREIRGPLSDIMTVTKPILESLDSVTLDQATKVNRSFYRIIRLINNMSDAHRFADRTIFRITNQDICSVLREVFAKAADLVATAGSTLDYTGPKEPIYCPIDEAALERAIYNIISNSLKFTPTGGIIKANLTRHDHKLHLTIEDNGRSIDVQTLRTIYTRYHREPGIGDFECGIGLGLPMIHAVAAAHGGVVLINEPNESGTRIMMTIDIRQTKPTTLHTGKLSMDYTGGWDRALVDLSEVLPNQLYKYE